MKPPIEPRQEDCCNSGCNPCIFDVYLKHLKLYKENSKDIDDQISQQNGISELEYTHFTITDVKQLNNVLKILKFRRSNIIQHLKVKWKPGAHFLIKYTSDNVSCTRAYTPIKLKSQANEDFDFLIVLKKYEGGPVSSYLFNLEIGEETVWRGPYGHYNIEPNKYKRIVMIAQGTGIAPFISMIESVLNNEDDMTTIVLYFCCRNINEILFKDVLYEFNAYWNFTYKIFLSDHTDAKCNLKYKEPIIFEKFSNKELDILKPFCDTQFVLCGSSKFMEQYKSYLKTEGDIKTIVLL